MNLDEIAAVLKEVARLLNLAEHSARATERKNARHQLKAMRAELADQLRDADASPEPRRAVTVASLKATMTIIDNELADIEARNRPRDLKA